MLDEADYKLTNTERLVWLELRAFRPVLRRCPAVLQAAAALRALLRFGGFRRRPCPRQPDVHVPHAPVVVGLEARKGCQQPCQRGQVGVQLDLAHLQELVLVQQPGAPLNHHRWMSAGQDESNGTLLITWAPNPEGQPFGPGTGRTHPPLTVKQLVGYLSQLPQDMIVEAEGCDCVNEVKGAGLHRPSPDDKGGPRCILVCEPDFYGVLGPDERERHRRMDLKRRTREQTQREQAGETNKGPETSGKTFI